MFIQLVITAVSQILEEVRLREADIVDLKKALREERISTRKLMVALDATRTERNMLHKNYTEALDEIQDLKQKLKVNILSTKRSKRSALFSALFNRHRNLNINSYDIL